MKVENWQNKLYKLVAELSGRDLETLDANEVIAYLGNKLEVDWTIVLSFEG